MDENAEIVTRERFVELCDGLYSYVPDGYGMAVIVLFLKGDSFRWHFQGMGAKQHLFDLLESHSRVTSGESEQVNPQPLLHPAVTRSVEVLGDKLPPNHEIIVFITDNAPINHRGSLALRSSFVSTADARLTSTALKAVYAERDTIQPRVVRPPGS